MIPMEIPLSLKKLYFRRIFRLKRLLYQYSAQRKSESRENRALLEETRKNGGKSSSSTKPLISISIATYNRGEILSKRVVPSILRQSYQNFEVIIVGDHCTDNTETLLKEFNDDRIKFYNLPERGKYPESLFARWCVAGIVPRNKSLEILSGEWIATLDDDDEFSDDHLEVLLRAVQENDYEMVYGKVLMEVKPDKWAALGSYPLRHGQISHMSALYSARLKFFKYKMDSWKCGEPADWNMWRRMQDAGVKVGFIDKVVGKHYLEGAQTNG